MTQHSKDEIENEDILDEMQEEIEELEDAE
jgi:hypothetical protein